MPHREEDEVSRTAPREFTPEAYPEFPSGLPTVDLETISLAKLLGPDSNDERNRVFKACKGRGFFYLELGGCEAGDTILHGADRLIGSVGEELFALPLDEKMSYHLTGGSLDGYKSVGLTFTDKARTPDTAEFFNVGKNEMIVPDNQMKKRWPDVIKTAKPLFREYMCTAHDIGMQILSILAVKLGVDEAEFACRHRIEEQSGDIVRLTRGPPRDKEEMPEIQTPSHTDFGTITILMNWLGGLQVWSESARKAQLHNSEPDSPGEWLWVRPKKGCAIINLGDAAVKFTNGVLCSGRHRAPGAQSKFHRYSLVYFVRPEDNCIMKQLRASAIPDGPEEEQIITAREWIKAQAEGLGTRWQDN
ncbi:Clavaminate synthase-like protein [Xylariaceae sp. FL0255]|nr:Clavaminate synthase-like protein [Xylariaceae sp. FL0255]